MKHVPILPAILLSASIGAISVSGWAPLEWWPVALASYAALFWLVQCADRAVKAGLIGLAFGVGLHMVGHGWVYSALHMKSGLAAIPAVLSTAVFIAYLAAFIAMPCGLFWWLFHSLSRRAADIASTFLSTMLFASLLTLGEWARSLFFNGFTSLSLGYSLIDTYFAGYAPIAGLYGVSWVGMSVAVLSFLLISKCRITQVIAAISVLLFALAGSILIRKPWTENVGLPLSYRLIQSNVEQEKKFDPKYTRLQIRNLVSTIEQEPANIIATAETAFSVFLNELPADALPHLQQFARRTGSHVFVGIAITAANADGYNSVLRVAPGDHLGDMERYNKMRLMPFGEYSPVGFGWFTGSLSIPLKDMKAGASIQRPFALIAHGERQEIGTMICHEDLIGRDMVQWGASINLFLNPSNLAWFDDSLAIAQRLQIVRMRALETGKPILRIANTGVTAHIDARGNVLAQLPTTREGVLSGFVQPTQGNTMYMVLGDALAVTLSSLCVVFTLAWARRRGSTRS